MIIKLQRELSARTKANALDKCYAHYANHSLPDVITMLRIKQIMKRNNNLKISYFYQQKRQKLCLLQRSNENMIFRLYTIQFELQRET